MVPNQQVAGAGRGSFALDDCVAEGISAGAAAAGAAGFDPENSGAAVDPLVFSEPKASAPTRQLWLVPGQEGGPDDWHHHFVDFQRDQSVADVLRSTGAGMRSVEHVKRYTSISTANTRARPPGLTRSA
jgi:sarcosine oxidase subunit alpha